ncbi:pyridoxamine 5'-phosphate oxidase family protein, partial [Streptomyces sparsus]
MQERLGSTGRADRFYDEQLLDHLNERMREFAQRQEMFFLATADRNGECDSSFRAGPQGFLQVLDERTLAYPEYRGNGVHASLGNIEENPRLGILMIDFVRARIGLHVNGRAEIVEDAEIRAEHPHLPHDPVPGRRPELWVRVTVEEAYIHCAKHIPHLQYAPKRPAREWGTDDYKRKGGDFFGAARDRVAREHDVEYRGGEEADPVPHSRPATVPPQVRPEPEPEPTAHAAAVVASADRVG